MKVHFSKYQGTGNDFVLVNNIEGVYPDFTLSQIRFICDRKFGIGSDGFIVLQQRENHDFYMDFYNPDGSKSFCGNGARCAVKFAGDLGFLDSSSVSFQAIDGGHEALLCGDDVKLQMSCSKMPEVIFSGNQDIGPYKKAFFMDTGSPHFAVYVNELSELNTSNVLSIGRKIRNSSAYAENGVNVNLIYIHGPDILSMATYERGVEHETLSCGTGATACALIHAQQREAGSQTILLKTKGGELQISFERNSHGVFSNVHLIGPANLIYEGTISI